AAPHRPLAVHLLKSSRRRSPPRGPRSPRPDQYPQVRMRLFSIGRASFLRRRFSPLWFLRVGLQPPPPSWTLDRGTGICRTPGSRLGMCKWAHLSWDTGINGRRHEDARTERTVRTNRQNCEDRPTDRQTILNLAPVPPPFLLLQCLIEISGILVGYQPLLPALPFSPEHRAPSSGQGVMPLSSPAAEVLSRPDTSSDFSITLSLLSVVMLLAVLLLFCVRLRVIRKCHGRSIARAAAQACDESRQHCRLLSPDPQPAAQGAPVLAGTAQHGGGLQGQRNRNGGEITEPSPKGPAGSVMLCDLWGCFRGSQEPCHGGHESLSLGRGSVPRGSQDWRAGRVVGVAQAINKKSGNGGTFTEKDEKDFAAYLAFCGIVLHNAQLYETSLLENKRNQVLLDLASLIFEEQQSLEVILKKIAATIISFMQVQKCTIFIVDEDCSDPFSSVFHMECEELEKSSDSLTRERDASRLNYMYAQYVKNTMEPLNIPDVSKDQRFPWTNENTGSVNQQCIRSLLCTPIKNGKKNKVIGVCQLVNKMEENTGKIKPFNRNDEQFLEAFVIFCGLGIQNTQMYEAVERAMAKQMVTLEVLSYHASAAEEETRELQSLAAAVVPSAQTLKITDFSFSDFELSDLETALCTIRMFTDLNLVQNFQMKHEVLCRWILSVKKNYRKNVAYHNWRHAFNTAQCMFAALKAGKIQSKLSDLETLALLIATLSHDLDHRGLNNSYIQRSEHPLAQLYCHSIMEHHHFDQCLMILNSPGNQILSGLSIEEYKTTLKIIKQAILATDLALYIKRRGEFFELIRKNQFNLEDPHQKELFLAMLMTACDLSAITKPWPVQQRVRCLVMTNIAELVASEFFDQGDKERKELNIEPADLMNREKKNKIPSMQVGFIDAICLQLYEALTQVSQDCFPLLDGCRKNRQKWQALAEHQEKTVVNGESSQAKRN
ncbi:cGMP-specific 3',5'-cyclic phosphodiesterase, partial [Galemys pyrenaicus]